MERRSRSGTNKKAAKKKSTVWKKERRERGFGLRKERRSAAAFVSGYITALNDSVETSEGLGGYNGRT